MALNMHNIYTWTLSNSKDVFKVTNSSGTVIWRKRIAISYSCSCCSVSSGGISERRYGEGSFTVTFSPNTGYSMSSMSASNATYSKSGNTITVTPNFSGAVVVYGTATANTYKLTVREYPQQSTAVNPETSNLSLNPTGTSGGTTSDYGRYSYYSYGTSVTVTDSGISSPRDGFQWYCWSKDGTSYTGQTGTTFTTTVTSNTTINPQFLTRCTVYPWSYAYKGYSSGTAVIKVGAWNSSGSRPTLSATTATQFTSPSYYTRYISAQVPSTYYKFTGWKCYWDFDTSDVRTYSVTETTSLVDTIINDSSHMTALDEPISCYPMYNTYVYLCTSDVGPDSGWEVAVGVKWVSSLNGASYNWTNTDTNYTYLYYSGTKHATGLGTSSNTSGTVSIVPYTYGNLVMSSDYCIMEGTQITLADGTTKNIEDININDMVMGYDIIDNKNIPSKVIYVKKAFDDIYTFDRHQFSNDITIDTFGKHSFYNVEQERTAFITNFKLGYHGIDINNNQPELLSRDSISSNAPLCSYVLITTTSNYFANGLLSMQNAKEPVQRLSDKVNEGLLDIPEDLWNNWQKDYEDNMISLTYRDDQRFIDIEAYRTEVKDKIEKELPTLFEEPYQSDIAEYIMLQRAANLQIAKILDYIKENYYDSCPEENKAKFDELYNEGKGLQAMKDRVVAEIFGVQNYSTRYKEIFDRCFKRDRELFDIANSITYPELDESEVGC